MLKNIIKAIFTLLAVSTIFTYPFTTTWSKFLQGVIVCTILQIILYNVYIKFYRIYVIKVNNEREKELVTRGTYVTCPCYLEKRDFIPVSFTSDNNYTCLHCNKRVAVSCEVKTYLTTDPLPLEGTAEGLLRKAQQNMPNKNTNERI